MRLSLSPDVAAVSVASSVAEFYTIFIAPASRYHPSPSLRLLQAPNNKALDIINKTVVHIIKRQAVCAYLLER